MQAEKQRKETMTRTQRKTQLYLHNRAVRGHERCWAQVNRIQVTTQARNTTKYTTEETQDCKNSRRKSLTNTYTRA